MHRGHGRALPELSHPGEKLLVTPNPSPSPSRHPNPGEKLCTFNGKYHLAWSVPMADPSYFMPSAQAAYSLIA